MTHTSPQKRPQISEYIRRWQRTNRIAKTVKLKREKLNRELARSAMEAMVQVSEAIYPGVRIRVGERSTEIKIEINDTTLTRETWSVDGQLRAA